MRDCSTGDIDHQESIRTLPSDEESSPVGGDGQIERAHVTGRGDTVKQRASCAFDVTGVAVQGARLRTRIVGHMLQGRKIAKTG